MENRLPCLFHEEMEIRLTRKTSIIHPYEASYRIKICAITFTVIQEDLSYDESDITTLRQAHFGGYEHLADLGEWSVAAKIYVHDAS